MHADVVVANGGASCDVDGRIWSTLSRYCGWIILECWTLAGARGVSSLRLCAAWVRTACVWKSFRNVHGVTMYKRAEKKKPTHVKYGMN